MMMMTRLLPRSRSLTLTGDPICSVMRFVVNKTGTSNDEKIKNNKNDWKSEPNLSG